jgi:PD-(D/E)XK nuclease superfamily
MTSLSLEPARLKHFFEQFAKLYHGEPISSRKPELPILDIIRFKQFAVAFAEKYTPVYEAGFNLNLFHVFDFRHDEVKNARILTWLFDPHGSHGQGKAIWHAFLDVLAKRKPDSAFLKLEYWQNYHVRREVYPLGDSKNRIDLVLKSASAILFIEVKIYAYEGEEQGSRYQKALSRYVYIDEDKRGLVYLDLKGEDKGYVPATWRDVAIALKTLNFSKNTPFGFFSSQFCHHITNF